MVLPELVDHGVQDGDREDRNNHLDINEDPVWMKEGEINPVDFVRLPIQEVWQHVEEPLLPCHAGGIVQQPGGVVQGGANDECWDVHASLHSKDILAGYMMGMMGM